MQAAREVASALRQSDNSVWRGDDDDEEYSADKCIESIAIVDI